MRSATDDWLYAAAALGGLSLTLAAALLWMRRQRAGETAADDLEPPSEPAEPWIPPAARPGAPAAAGGAFAAPAHAAPATAPSRAVERVPPAWELADEALAPIAPITVIDEHAEEHESAIELAEIMIGFGRIQGAAETLAEFIASNPKKAVTPWLKLLEVYRAAGLRPEFDALARQLNKTFNVKAVTWDTFDEARRPTHSIEHMAHVSANVQQLWGTQECQAYLEKLLRDNRDGTREGFPLNVIDEILVLADILEERLGPYRAPAEPPTSPADEIPSQPA